MNDEWLFGLGEGVNGIQVSLLACRGITDVTRLFHIFNQFKWILLFLFENNRGTHSICDNRDNSLKSENPEIGLVFIPNELFHWYDHAIKQFLNSQNLLRNHNFFLNLISQQKFQIYVLACL